MTIDRPQLYIPDWPAREGFEAANDSQDPFAAQIKGWMDELEINPLDLHPDAPNEEKFDTRIRRHALGIYMGEVLQTVPVEDAAELGLTGDRERMIENQRQRLMLVAVTRSMNEETGFSDVNLTEAMKHAGAESDKVAAKIPTMEANGSNPIYTDPVLQKSVYGSMLTHLRDEKGRNLQALEPAKWIKAVARRQIAMIGMDLSYRVNVGGFLDYIYDDQRAADLQKLEQTG